MSDERKQVIPGFIGGYLYESGLITAEQLDAALDRQLDLSVHGRTLRLGEVLVEMGAISRSQLEGTMAQQLADQDKRRRAQGKRTSNPVLD